MATPFDRLLLNMQPHLPGAIDRAIKQELYMTCLDFFKKSNTWQEDYTAVVSNGIQDFIITPLAGRFERLMWVSSDDVPVRGATMRDLKAGIVHLPYEVNTSGTYVVTMALTVADPISVDAFPIVPEDLVERYTEELGHGLLARMMAQPAKPYTNMQLASVYTLKFNGGIARARNEMKTGSTYGSQNWVYPQNFRTR